MEKRFDVLVYIGRFQPFHNGHLAVVREALQLAHRVVVALGSAKRGRNVKNPFSDAERERMVRACLEVDAMPNERVSIVRVRDYYDNEKWVSAVKREVASHIEGVARIGLIGYFKDDSSYYLREFPNWELVITQNWAGLSATNLRHELFSKGLRGPWSVIVNSAPIPVVSQLREFCASSVFSDLQAEFQTVEEGKRAWASAPYPPIFSTVDTVLTARAHVLLIERRHPPGKGQWALPGGFVNPDERLFDAAVRELAEETGIEVNAITLRRAYRDREVFDHPDRSVRGRTITHAFFFDLQSADLPKVVGADDAAAARWIPLEDLIKMESVFFEDHLHIVNRFVPIL